MKVIHNNAIKHYYYEAQPGLASNLSNWEVTGNFNWCVKEYQVNKKAKGRACWPWQVSACRGEVKQSYKVNKQHHSFSGFVTGEFEEA